MSEQDKRRGPQGVQGVQGVEGIEGQGIQGVPGKQGEPGIAGPRGRGVLGRNVTLSFGLVIMVAFIIIAIFTFQLRSTRQVARENRDLIAQGAEIRGELVRGLKRTDLALCRSTNESRDVLADIIRGILSSTGGTGPGDDSRKAALVRLKLKDCSKLPGQKRNP